MTLYPIPSGDTMTTSLPPLARDYLRAVNEHDAPSFLKLFDSDAVVDDNFRLIHGLAEIEKWAIKEIFDANVSFELRGVNESPDDMTLTTKVDGNFDRTGLPDPVIIRHTLTAGDGKIAKLTCRLAQD